MGQRAAGRASSPSSHSPGWPRVTLRHRPYHLLSPGLRAAPPHCPTLAEHSRNLRAIPVLSYLSPCLEPPSRRGQLSNSDLEPALGHLPKYTHPFAQTQAGSL